MPVLAEEEQGEMVECDEDENDESQEVQETKIAPSPSLPSAAEVEEHRVTHLPFRSKGARGTEKFQTSASTESDCGHWRRLFLHDRQRLVQPRRDERAVPVDA